MPIIVTPALSTAKVVYPDRNYKSTNTHHTCDRMPGGVGITWHERHLGIECGELIIAGVWRMCVRYNADSDTDIKYCPYCGEELV